MTGDHQPIPARERSSQPGAEPSLHFRRTALWVPVLSAAAAMVAIYAVRKVLLVYQVVDVDSGLQAPGVRLLAMAVFLLLGLRLGIGAAASGQTGRWSAALTGLAATYGGIAAGVVVWALVEELILRHFGVYPIYEEHNLFPIEIVMWWVMAALPLLAGTALGLILFGRSGSHHGPHEQ